MYDIMLGEKKVIKGIWYYMKNKKTVLKNIMNLIVLLLSMELINIIVTEIPEFRNIDLRLVFVFIVANFMGMGYGIIEEFSMYFIGYLFSFIYNS